MQQTFARALVALDLSQMDRKLVSYIARAAPLLGIQRLYLVHIMPSLTEPENIDAEFHALFNADYPLDEKIANDIGEMVKAEMKAAEGVEWSVEVREGKPYQKLMHWIEVKDIDLLVVGKKQQHEGSGITAKRVARKAKCHVLFVTAEAQPDWRRVWVPIDFSDNSAKALRIARKCCHQKENCTSSAAYVVEMPINDFYLQQITSPDYRGILMESAQTACQSFLADHDLPEDLEVNFLENQLGNISRHLAEYAETEKPDLVIMGAQGHSGLEKFLYGSVTESLLEKMHTRPVLIIR